MKIKIPFRINYPLKILDKNRKVNFLDKKERNEIFSRNIFYLNYEKEKNLLLEKRHEKYLLLGKEIKKFIREKYPQKKILSISLFGSSLYSKAQRDFDFLVILEGNFFDLKEKEITLGDKKEKVGISIKGLDNLEKGLFNLKSKIPLREQKQIIERTSSLLYTRHIPLIGHDFLENRENFRKNIFAQINDLLFNTYHLYYNGNKRNLDEKNRAEKIISRIYEAVSYLSLKQENSKLNEFRKKVYFLDKNIDLKKSKEIFDSFYSIFEKKTRKLISEINEEINFKQDLAQFKGILNKTKRLLKREDIGIFLPVIARIVDNRGNIISEGKREKTSSGPHHAEISAIEEAISKNKKNWSKYILYCSLEPCKDCANKICDLGFQKVVYSLPDPFLDYYGRVNGLYPQEDILFYRHNSSEITGSFQKIYREIYQRKIPEKDMVLKILSKKKCFNNIRERLKNYWDFMGLPSNWIPQILNILKENRDDEDLAINLVREKFSQIQNKNSKYSKSLRSWRQVKVDNLSKKIDEYIVGEKFADVGGRKIDLSEKLLENNQNILSVFVTDIIPLSEKPKNPKIKFLVQNLKNKIPLKENSINTILFSMVLHHLDRKNQKKLLQSASKTLKKGGRIILIEDTYPKNMKNKFLSKNMKNFLKFDEKEKKQILSFYDWFGNRLMRNRDKILLTYEYRRMDEWKEMMKSLGLKELKSEFVKADLSHPSLFPPKAIMIFEK